MNERKAIMTMVLLMERGATDAAWAAFRRYVISVTSEECWEKVRVNFEYRRPTQRENSFWYCTSKSEVARALGVDI